MYSTVAVVVRVRLGDGGRHERLVARTALASERRHRRRLRRRCRRGATKLVDRTRTTHRPHTAPPAALLAFARVPTQALFTIVTATATTLRLRQNLSVTHSDGVILSYFYLLASISYVIRVRNV